MRRTIAIIVVLAGAGCAWDASAWGQVSADWPTERVEMLDGRQYVGLIESEDESWVNLVQIRRTPGRPMHLVIRPIGRRQVAAVVRLEGPRRAELRQRIDQFINRATIESGRMDAVELASIQSVDGRYRHYRGKWFSLDSTIDEPTTRRIIVRVEQVFTAYRQMLPPRVQPARPLRLLVFGSPEEYHAYLDRLGVKIDRRACFLEKENLVVAGSEVARFAAELAKVNDRHEQLRDELDHLKKQTKERIRALARQLQQQGNRKRELTRLLLIEKRRTREQLDEKQKEINRYDRENAQVFDKVTRRMFTRLYHEAFHAYLENYVYPHDRYDVPLWLNEGLAVLFESGLMESDSLRIDAPAPAALRKLKADLSTGKSLSLGELLRADRGDFSHSHDITSDRYYLHAWGLVYYLAFERHLFDSAALDRYVEQSAAGLAPIERFERFVGMPLDQFERQWRQYMAKLR